MRRRGVKKQGKSECEGALAILLLVAFAPVICSAGILDSWQWARSDRMEVNILWLPCKFVRYRYIYIVLPASLPPTNSAAGAYTPDLVFLSWSHRCTSCNRIYLSYTPRARPTCVFYARFTLWLQKRLKKALWRKKFNDFFSCTIVRLTWILNGFKLKFCTCKYETEIFLII